MAGMKLSKRLSLALPTVLGLARRGYFIPYRYAAGIPDTAARAPFPALEALFERHRSRFLSLLKDEALIADLARRYDGARPPQPRWQQTWFPRLDGLALSLMIRRHRPARIVEVGSGHSTRFAAAAIAEEGLATRIDAIDPAPRADIAGLPSVTVHRQIVQTAAPDLFTALAPGDFLLIDSSHLALPGSDVDLLLGRILPALPVGVFVQIHDIFLPEPYPESWTWRGYNEQLPVATLLAGGGFEPLWSSHWVATRCREVLQSGPVGTLPLAPEALESALWLKKTG